MGFSDGVVTIAGLNRGIRQIRPPIAHDPSADPQPADQRVDDDFDRNVFPVLLPARQVQIQVLLPAGLDGDHAVGLIFPFVVEAALRLQRCALAVGVDDTDGGLNRV